MWRATDHVLGRQVAIKKLSAQLTTDPVASERFRREAQAAARLNHPGILVVHDAGNDDDGPWIAMELIQGETLAARLTRQGSLPLADVLAITGQVAAALDHAHQSGVIHRDIKPANIVIEDDGRVRLTDFGIAKAIDDPTAITSTGEVVGTISYMAPEILAGKPASIRSDIYSLGALVYEMISGAKPFVADNLADLMAAIGSAEPPPLSGRVDSEVVEAVSQSMDKDPERRPLSAGHFAENLTSSSTVPFNPTLSRTRPMDFGADQEAPTLVVPSPASSGIDTNALGIRRNVPRRHQLSGTTIGLVVFLAATAVGLALVFSLQQEPEPPEQAAPPPSAVPPTTIPPTTTAASTIPTEVNSSEQVILVANEIIDLLGTLEAPEYRSREVGRIDREVREAVEDWGEEDGQAAEHLQQALDHVRRLPNTENRGQLVDLLVSLAEAMGFRVEREG